jgi:ribosomal protein L37AE/L43A
MKKSLILILLIIIVGILFAACEMGKIYYCPYCSYSSIKKVDADTYKCQRPSCGKTFYAYH